MWEHPVTLVIIAAAVGSIATLLTTAVINPRSEEAIQRRRNRFHIARTLQSTSRIKNSLVIPGRTREGKLKHFETLKPLLTVEKFVTKLEIDILGYLSWVVASKGTLQYDKKAHKKAITAIIVIFGTPKWRVFRQHRAKRQYLESINSLNDYEDDIMRQYHEQVESWWEEKEREDVRGETRT